MKAIDIPSRPPSPFAVSASPGTTIRDIPETTSDPNAASYELGFPPNTFAPIGSGGQPPDGRDFNGILNTTSGWSWWNAAGGPVEYNVDFAAAVNGYPKGAMIASPYPGFSWISLVDDNLSNPNTGGANWAYANARSAFLIPEQFGAAGDGVTDDTAAVIACVALAFTTGLDVFLMSSYLTTASIPNFHNGVSYLGAGSIKRGSDTFTPNLEFAGANVLYVAVGGNDSNDGFSAAQAIATPQVAVNALTNYGPVLSGDWNVQLGTGTWNDGISMPENLQAGPSSQAYYNNRINIKGTPVGGSPNTPVTIINGNVSPTTNYGILMNGANNLYLQDLLFQNWDTTASSYGINASDLSSFYLNNVHVVDCTFGIIGRIGRFYLQGGLVDSCVEGITFLNGAVFTIGNIDPVTVQNCAVTGTTIQEGASGHFDLGAIDNCEIGLYLVENSHCQISSTIENCAIGIRCAVNSSYYDAGIIFNANDVNVLRYSSSFEVASSFTQPTKSRLYATTQQNSMGPGTLTETTLYAALGTIPAKVFQSGNNGIKVTLVGAFGGNHADRTLRLKANGTTIATIVFPGDATVATSAFDLQIWWDAQTPTAQIANSVLHVAHAPYYSSQVFSATAIDVSGDVVLSMTGQVGDVLDQIVGYRVEVEIL